MNEDLKAIIDFVEGRISLEDFAFQLDSNPNFKTLLENDSHLQPHTYVGRNVYSFIMKEDLSDFIGAINIRGALVEYLVRNGIEVTPDEQALNLYRLILAAQPDWLDVDVNFVCNEILPNAKELSGDALKSWLQEQFHQRFQYVKMPPKWIQSPDWPIKKNRPLIFFGQFDVENFFHDVASVYTFYDPDTGECESIIQVF